MSYFAAAHAVIAGVLLVAAALAVSTGHGRRAFCLFLASLVLAISAAWL